MPFRSGQGETTNTSKIDLGTDPLSTEQIPIPDGVGFMLLLAVGYALWKWKA